MSSTKDLNLGVDIEIHNGDQSQEHARRSLGRDGENTKTNQHPNQHHQVNGGKPTESPTSLSWWRRTTSLPSSLNRKKNILFQELRNKTKLNLGERLLFFQQCRYNGAVERSFVVQNIILSFLPDTLLHYTHFELRLSFQTLRKCLNQQMIWRKGNSNSPRPWRKIGKDFLKSPANVWW